MKHSVVSIPEPTSRGRSLEEIAVALERTEEFRVLRRLRPRDVYIDDVAEQETRVGLIIDVETTGLNRRQDEVIELGMVKFRYLPDGRVCSVVNTFAAFSEPAIRVPSEITELTGISNEMLIGQRIDPAAVASFASDVAIVIAHNAAFDRQFSERYWPLFEHLPWACSATQISWRAMGFEGARLVHLLAGIGLFHDAHRAVDDCQALLEVLAFRPETQAEPLLGKLLAVARRNTCRVWAEQSPFEMKEQLKKRGYRWCDGTEGRRKSWYTDVDEAMVEAEIDFLRTEIYGRDVDLSIEELDAFTMFSNRA